MPDPTRVAARLQELWQIAHGPDGGADRPAYSPAEAEAMALVAQWAREAGLQPGLDSHGNLWALPRGWDGPLVTAGSHVDTVPDGGRYDGALGTVLGLELADELRARPGGRRAPGAARLRRGGGAAVRRRHDRLSAARRHARPRRARGAARRGWDHG